MSTREKCSCGHTWTRHRQQYGEPHTGPCRAPGCICLRYQLNRERRIEYAQRLCSWAVMAAAQDRADFARRVADAEKRGSR